MSELKFNTYPWQTSPEEVVAVVETVARSKAPHVEFGLESDAAAAAREASEFGWLEFVSNGVVQLTQAGLHLSMEKDPVGMAMNTAAIRRMMKSRLRDRGACLTFGQAGAGMSFLGGDPALTQAVRVGASDATRRFLAPPKNRPFYRQFVKAKF